MRRRPWLLLLASAVAVTSCAGREPPGQPPRRDDLLRQAFALAPAAPLQAAEILERAGPGAFLERAQLDAWMECLERGKASTRAWQRFLAAGLPPDLRPVARERLALACHASGDLAGAVASLEEAAREGLSHADELLLGLPDPGARRRAGERLGLRSPDRLRALAPDLERELLGHLAPEQWLERATSWRLAGRPLAAVTELAKLRWSGPVEVRRRLELAQAQLAAGQASRVLAALPRRRAGAPELLLRADAYRRLAWAREPEPGAQTLFSSCAEEARKAAATASGEERLGADELLLECGVESGRLDDAVSAWWRLQAGGWDSSRREWLGRRLGLALAARPARRRQALDVAGSLPEHRRCLRYWVATAAEAGQGRSELEALARAPFPDLYAMWAAEELGLARPVPVHLRPAAGSREPPRSVRLLLDWGATGPALAEWRRIRGTRALTAAEALAAAALERAAGEHNQAIACLRSALPELGRTDMESAPEEAVRAYLPLGWKNELVAAARRAGLEPWLLAAVVRQESLFTPTAVSPRGARGLLQLLPGTARPHAVAVGLGPRPDLFDPAVNLQLGARELARLLRRFGEVEPALAAYNAGEGRARRWWQRWPDRRRFTEAMPIPETYTYVRRVVYLAEAYRVVYGSQWREP